MSRTVKSTKELKTLPAYELQYEEYLDEIGSAGICYKHKKSGARIIIMSNDDNNKCFSIGFRTPVTDSTGVPHIIEHSVLCGSDKYPVKDPFMELAKGSLNTFLNAMTYPDKTVYPVASCNDQDFKNLMGVYMDAVLHPLIYSRPEIFRQEGWRYELESAESELKFNGVVYSEMKGAMSSPERMLFEHMFEALFPDITYGKNSGGEPADIPNLTYEQFIDFHSRFYHPCNSYIYLYGDMDIEERLEWLDAEYLSKYEAISIDSEIQLQKAENAVKDATFYYPISAEDNDEKKAYFSVNYVIGSEKTPLENEAVSLICDALFSKQGAPVKQALIDAGIGEEVSGDSEYDIRQAFAFVVSKNAEASRKQEFLDIIDRTIAEEIKKGFNKKTILASINKREFSYREGDTGRMPKGLVYMDIVLNRMLYDETKAFDGFKYGKLCDKLRELLEGDYFEKLAEEKFLKSKHKSVVTLLPKKGMAEEEEKAVADKLAAYKASLSAAEIDKLVEDTKALRAFQEEVDSPEAKATIPMLAREDMNKVVKPFSNIEKKVAGVPVVLHDYNTSGIAYMTFVCNLQGLEEENLPYAQLATELLTMLDTDKYTYSDLDDEINLTMGGLGIAVTASQNDEQKNYRTVFGFNLKCLYAKLADSLSLLENIINHTDYSDDKRILDLLNELRSGLQSKLSYAGHSTAINRCRSYVSEGGLINERISGIDYYNFIDKIIKNYDDYKDIIKSNVKTLVENIITKENLIIGIAAEPEGYAEFEKQAGLFVDKLPESGKYGSKCEPVKYTLNKGNEAFTDSGKVTYSAVCGKFDAKGEPNGAMKVLSTIVKNDYLYPLIRVKGGAYGAFCGFNALSGSGFFGTYRDPKIKESLDVFEGATKFVEEFDATEQEMTKYIIGTMGVEDAPLNARQAGDRSMDAYLCDRKLEVLQKQRDEILAVTPADIRAAAGKIKEVLSSGAHCTFGSESIIKSNAELFDVITPLVPNGDK